MPGSGPFVAVALLTRAELMGVGDALRCVLPIERVPDDFADLLAAIDEAEEGRPGGARETR